MCPLAYRCSLDSLSLGEVDTLISFPQITVPTVTNPLWNHHLLYWNYSSTTLCFLSIRHWRARSFNFFLSTMKYIFSLPLVFVIRLQLETANTKQTVKRAEGTEWGAGMKIPPFPLIGTLNRSKQGPKPILLTNWPPLLHRVSPWKQKAHLLTPVSQGSWPASEPNSCHVTSENQMIWKDKSSSQMLQVFLWEHHQFH